ncbi:oligosaccharide flippase family protein [Isobaculum melis]|uniref:Membrane protein involved in the export of O-antigen and teichoic acid n=1 Tax=Isobaculum melis TaxID=142588 RepID=A0A1H9SLP3_9LACT|nr:oligosaccharide flippase family protein [Isobaculum melis]SER85906.1 Membrane protein involved in the export of O-antigen and teichoic acid [Isobaculum melis]
MKVLKNYLYNTSYQLLSIILPIVTIPYISRVLGPSGTGLNTYTQSIVQYFVLFGMLGVNYYGNREIASSNNEKEKVSKKFFEIYILQMLTCLLAFVLYAVFVLFLNYNSSLMFIQSIYIISAFFDISWFFLGLEKFGGVVIRNTFVKIIGTILMFLFVKNENDVYLYAFIIAISTLIGQLVMWLSLKGYLVKVKFTVLLKEISIRKSFNNHFKGMLLLFIPQIAIQVFNIMDKILLGYHSGSADVAYYDGAYKVTRIALTLLTSLGTVMLPRMSKEIAAGNTKKVLEYLKKSLDFVLFFSIPLMAGLILIPPKFVPWFFGDGYQQVELLMPIISVIVLFIAVNNVIGVQYMIPSRMNKEYTISVVTGAVVDIIFNIIFVFILDLNAVGAAISLVIAEFSVVLVQMFYAKKILKQIISSETIKYIIASIIMFIFVNFVTTTMSAHIGATLIQALLGILVYGFVLIVLRAHIITMFLNMIQKSKKVFK